MWHPAERSLSGRRAVYAMDVVEQCTLRMSRNSYGGLKLGLLTPHKVTADYLIVPQKQVPPWKRNTEKKFWFIWDFAFFVLLLVRLRNCHNYCEIA